MKTRNGGIAHHGRKESTNTSFNKGKQNYRRSRRLLTFLRIFDALFYVDVYSCLVAKSVKFVNWKQTFGGTRTCICAHTHVVRIWQKMIQIGILQLYTLMPYIKHRVLGVVFAHYTRTVWARFNANFVMVNRPGNLYLFGDKQRYIIWRQLATCLSTLCFVVTKYASLECVPNFRSDHRFLDSVIKHCMRLRNHASGKHSLFI